MNTLPQAIPFEIVTHIFCVAKYKRALQFLRTCKYFSQDEAWALKCKVQFPRNHHFGVWTHREYYMALNSRPTFAVAVNFSDLKEVSNYIYEYHPVLEHIVGLSDEIIHTGEGYGAWDFVKFEKYPKKRFMVVKKAWTGGRCQNFKECSSIKSAKKYVEKDKKTDDGEYVIDSRSTEDSSSTEYSQYVIVDLKNTAPWFLTGPPVRKLPYNTKFYTFL